MKLMAVLFALLMPALPVYHVHAAEPLNCGERYARDWVIGAMRLAELSLSCLDTKDEQSIVHCVYMSKDGGIGLIDLRMNPLSVWTVEMGVWRQSSTDAATWTRLVAYTCDCSNDCELL